MCDILQVLEAPSISGNQAEADRATDALFGNVLQGPPSLTPQPRLEQVPCRVVLLLTLSLLEWVKTSAQMQLGIANCAILRPEGDV